MPDWVLESSGGTGVGPAISVSTDYTVTAPSVISADASSSSPLIVTLPPAASFVGQVTVVNVGTSGTVTVDANGSELIGGSLTWNLSTRWESLTIYSVGSAGWVIGSEVQVVGGGFDDKPWTEIDLTNNVVDLFSNSVSLGTGASLTMRYTRIGRYVRGNLIGNIAADHTIASGSGHLVIAQSSLPYAPKLLTQLAHASNFGYLGVPETAPGYTGAMIGSGGTHDHSGAGHSTYTAIAPLIGPPDSPIGLPTAATGVHTHEVTWFGGFLTGTTGPGDSGVLGTTAHTHARSDDGYIITIGPIFNDILGGGTMSLTFVHFSPQTSSGTIDNLFNITGRGFDGVTQYTPDITGRAFSLNTAFEYEAASIAT